MKNNEQDGNDLKQKVVDIEVSASSKQGRADAISKAFTDMRKHVYEVVNGAIIYLKPTNVQILEEKVTTSKEHFLFIFMPRIKEEVTMRLKISVEVQYMEL